MRPSFFTATHCLSDVRVGIAEEVLPSLLLLVYFQVVCQAAETNPASLNTRVYFPPSLCLFFSASGTVYTAMDVATGQEVSIHHQLTVGLLRCLVLMWS